MSLAWTRSVISTPTFPSPSYSTHIHCKCHPFGSSLLPSLSPDCWAPSIRQFLPPSCSPPPVVSGTHLHPGLSLPPTQAPELLIPIPRPFPSRLKLPSWLQTPSLCCSPSTQPHQCVLCGSTPSPGFNGFRGGGWGHTYAHMFIVKLIDFNKVYPTAVTSHCMLLLTGECLVKSVEPTCPCCSWLWGSSQHSLTRAVVSAPE